MQDTWDATSSKLLFMKGIYHMTLKKKQGQGEAAWRKLKGGGAKSERWLLRIYFSA